MMEPFVTVVMPIRNEARYIERSLGSVLGQDYPGDRMEVLIADGMSDDNTREIVEEIVQRQQKCLNSAGGDGNSTEHGPSVRIIDNPSRAVPGGLNKCLDVARGDVVVRIDGHSHIPPDYISNCLKVLNRTGAACVGGSIVTVGDTLTSKAIALAQSSVFGVGTVAFRTKQGVGAYVDTVAFGAYRTELFPLLGGFDEELVRNQDDEFNYRLGHAGYRIWLDPSISSVYYSRGDIRRLWRQYFQYGFWKVRVMQKHPRQMSWRQFVPPVFVISLLVSAGLAPFSELFRYFWLILLSGYSIAAISVSTVLAIKTSWRYFGLLLIAFCTLHLSYGFGFLAGLLRFGTRWRG